MTAERRETRTLRRLGGPIFGISVPVRSFWTVASFTIQLMFEDYSARGGSTVLRRMVE